MDVCTLAISWMKNKLLSPIKVIRPQDILLHLEAIIVACTLKFFLDIKQYNVLIDLDTIYNAS